MVEKQNLILKKGVNNKIVGERYNFEISSWRKSEPGFDPSFKNLEYLVTLKSWDTTKQSVNYEWKIVILGTI